MACRTPPRALRFKLHLAAQLLTVQRRPRSGSHRDSVAPIDGTCPNPGNVDRRHRGGGRRGSVDPVGCLTSSGPLPVGTDFCRIPVLSPWPILSSCLVDVIISPLYASTIPGSFSRGTSMCHTAPDGHRQATGKFWQQESKKQEQQSKNQTHKPSLFRVACPH